MHSDDRDEKMTETSTHSGNLTPKTDRRAHPRQRIQSLTYVELGGGNGGIVLNVSEGGMTVVAAQPLDADGSIEVALQLPQTRKRVSFKGEIRWLSDSRKEAGLRFVDLSSEVLADIRDWMRREASPDAASEEVITAVPALKTPERPAAEAVQPIPMIVEQEDLTPKPKQPKRVFEAERKAPLVAEPPTGAIPEAEPSQEAAPSAEIEERGEEPEAALPALRTRRTPFSDLAAGITPPRLAGKTPASNGTVASPVLSSESSFPLELPRLVASGSTAGSGKAKQAGTDFRVHLQSGWVLALLILVLALISFVSGMAVRRGALNHMLGDGEAYVAGKSPSANGAAAQPLENSLSHSAPGAVGSTPLMIEVVDSANRRWDVPASSGAVNQTLAVNPDSASGSISPNSPAAKTADAVVLGPSANKGTEAARASATPVAPLLVSMPEAPVAASSWVAISAQRFVRVPPDLAAKNRNPQVGSLANLVEPTYPPEAIEQKVEGTVKLHATIDASGNIQNLEVVSGPSALLTASVTSVREWRYNPTTLNGKAIETEEEITLVYRLPRK